MKGAFELSIIMIFSLPFVVFGMNFMQIVMSYNQARYFQDFIVTQIEHQNKLNDNVRELIDEGQKFCSSCTYEIDQISDRYAVTVKFPIDIPLIDYHSKGVTKMMTQVVYHIQNGIANITSYSHRNIAAKYFTEKSEQRSVKYCGNYANGKV